MTLLSELTLEQLQDMIAHEVRRQLRVVGSTGMPMAAAVSDSQLLDTRSWDEVKHSIEVNRWKPPPDAPSVLDLIRQDRDR